MDLDAILNNDGYHAPNPYYKKGNGQPKYILSDDPNYRPTSMADLFLQATKAGDLNRIGTESELGKYVRHGITPSELDTEQDYQKTLADRQSAMSKLGNALYQGLWNEGVVGTVKGFADLFDVITGAVFRPDNDYQNELSKTLEAYQEQFKEEHAIWTDPTKPDISKGALTDFGWWMSNLPSVMSSLTLLIPGTAFGKAASFVGKGARQLAKYTAKAAKAKKAIDSAESVARAERAAENVPKLSKFQKLINNPDNRTLGKLAFENGTTALAMRTLENYQEGRQVYNDMYEQSYDALKQMSNQEYQDWLNHHKNDLDGEDVDLNNRQEVAKHIANKAATRTFIEDYSNLLFDVIQVYTLRNAIKLPKSAPTTAAVNKAQRESKILFTKGQKEGQEVLSKRNILNKTKNWFGDRLNTKWIIASELGEGAEEAINYIAQQEGMHYGDYLLNGEKDNDTFGKRLAEYARSPQLYEAALWGVLGGVIFQGGGSGLKRATTAAKNTYNINKEARKHSNDTEGSNSIKHNKTTFIEQWRLSEDAGRTADIQARLSDREKLEQARAAIFDKDNPVDPNRKDNNGNYVKLNNEIEQQNAWNAAINEWLTSSTLRAIDNGNFKLYKQFLQDDNVRTVLKENGVIGDDSYLATVDNIVQQMDNIATRYQDRLVAVNDIIGAIRQQNRRSRKGTDDEIPYEYAQIIAKDSLYNELNLDRIRRQIENYEESAEANKRRFRYNLDESIDYKGMIDLINCTNYLSELKSEKNKIESDKTRKGSIEGQNRLNELNATIDILQKHIYDINNDKLSGLINIANSIFANFQSTSEDSDVYIDLRDAIASKDIKAISKITGIDYKLADDKIIELFGDKNDPSDEGLYGSFTKTMLNNFGVRTETNENGERVQKGVSKFVEQAEPLAEDYNHISTLGMAALIAESQSRLTTEAIRTKIDYLNNQMNKARVNAIKTSRDTLVELAQQYGSDIILDYVYNNIKNDSISEQDKIKLDNAIQILNLTAASNQQLAETIKFNILLGNLKRENSSASQNSSKTAQNPNPNTTSETGQKSTRTQESGQSGTSSQQNRQQADTTQVPNNIIGDRIAVSLDMDKGINVEFGNDDAGFRGVPYRTEEDIEGNTIYTLLTNNTQKDIKDNLVSNKELFDGYEENNRNNYRFVKNPKIIKDNNGNYRVLEKGQIAYATTQDNTRTKRQQTISSTGEEVRRDDNPIPTNDYEEMVEEENDNDTPADQPTDEEKDLTAKIENIYTELALSARNKPTDAEKLEALDKRAQELKEQFKDIPGISDRIDGAVRLYKRVPKFLGLQSKVNDIKYSTVRENAKHYDDTFINTVYDMFDEYAKLTNIELIDGKYYVNIEDFMRYLNNVYDNSEQGIDVFKKIRGFLNSKQNTKIVPKDNINASDIQDNAKKDSETRMRERIGKNSKHRVDIDTFFKNNNESAINEFYKLNIGDKLTIAIDGYTINLVHNGTIVGRLPVPVKEDGGYSMINDGWKYVIYDRKSSSPIEELFKKLSDNKELDVIIDKLNFANISEEERNNLVNKAYGIIIDNGGENYVTSDKKRVVEHIAKLWKYAIADINVSDNGDIKVGKRNLYLKLWFDKLYDSYDVITTLYEANDNNIEIVVDNINDGEIARVIEKGAPNVGEIRNNYDNFTQSNIAFANTKGVQIAVVKEGNKLHLIGAGNENSGIIEHNEVGPKGTVHVVIPNRSGKPNFAVATGIKGFDENIDKRSIAYQINKEAKSYLTNIINNVINNPDSTDVWNNARIALLDLFSLQTDNERKNYKNALYYGVDCYFTDDYFTISVENKTTGRQISYLFIKDNGGITVRKQSYVYQDGKYIQNYEETYDIESPIENMSDILTDNGDDSILPNAKFNVPFNIPTNIVTGQPGALYYSGDGKFKIHVGTKDFTFNTPSDAYINGGFLKVNVKPEPDGRVYRRKGIDQGANQILEVRVDRVEQTTPVKESSNTTSNKNTATDTTKKLEDIFTKDNPETAAEKIIKIAMPRLSKVNIDNLKKLELLPKNLIFAEQITMLDENGNIVNDDKGNPILANAMYNPTTKQISVSRVILNWISGLDENGNALPKQHQTFYKKQAIRKLIHEQLHAKLDNGDKAATLNKIKGVYEEFVESLHNLSTNTEQERNKLETLRQYIFADKATDEERWEEFLVESITSKTLADYLNTVQTEYKVDESKVTKESLWDKIINLIGKIFGYGTGKDFTVNDNTLLKKELLALQDALLDNNNNNNNNNDTNNDTQNDDFGDITLGDNIGGLQFSSIQERYSSVREYVSMFPNDMQSKIATKVETGEISSKCI